MNDLELATLRGTSNAEHKLKKSSLVLDHRIKEHKRGYTYAGNITSAEHSVNLGHRSRIDWDGAKVLRREQAWYRRYFMESWHIRQNRQSRSKDRGSILPDVCNSLIF